MIRLFCYGFLFCNSYKLLVEYVLDSKGVSMEKSTVFNFKNNILMLLVLALGFFVELFFSTVYLQMGGRENFGLLAHLSVL